MGSQPSRLSEPGVRPDSKFTDRAQRCHDQVMKKSPGVNPYAVCNASIIRKRGKSGAYKAGHYTK